MLYKVIGIMSGSSLDGLDIAYVHLQETGGKWDHEIISGECSSYNNEWKENLTNAVHLSALNYQLLHTNYGHYIGRQVNAFIEKNELQHKVDLICSHGHTIFHLPSQKMTAQIGDGASIAAETHLPVVTDLRSLDVALGGQGAPIVPIGEKILFKEYDCFLNLGGIANISICKNNEYIAFDVCPANKVLNLLANEKSIEFDEDGKLAASGEINENLLKQLNEIEYYGKPYPKSLDNSFGIENVYPLIKKTGISIEDALSTYVEHICQQISNAINAEQTKLYITGGGALNTFLIERLKILLNNKGIEVVIPNKEIIQYKEALIMALIGVLRWREEPTVLASVTGAMQSSIGGALWLGTKE